MSTSTAAIRQGAGLTGGVSSAVLGTTLPVDSTTALISAFKDLGGITDAGIVRTPTISTVDVRLRDGSLGRRLISSSETTFAFECVESQDNTFNVFFPGSTTVTTTGLTVQTMKAPTSNIRIWALDYLDGAIHHRIILPRAEVTDFGAVSYMVGGAISYPMTISAYVDASGNVGYEYTDDPNYV